MRTWDEMDRESIEVFRFGMERRLDEGETFNDAMGVSFATAEERLRSTSPRVEPEAFDIELSASMLCWWPLKPPPNPQQLTSARLLRRGLLNTYREDGRVALTYTATGRPEEEVAQLLFSGSTDAIFDFLVRRSSS
jgi:hypothetical protein